MLNLEKSSQAFAQAKEVMPGGVNSPVRSFARVKCDPPFIAKASGSKIYDIDGNEYIDYVGSWGPMIVGHAHPNVVKAIQEATTRGTSYGAPTLLETQLAKKVIELMPSIEKIRMVNSGTEATMSALRVARGYTGRDKIVKFIGCYHGHADSLLVKAGSGAATFGQPDSPGVTKGTAKDTITVPYNDIEAFVNLMNEQGDEIAAVIVEPVAGNMGLVLPKQGFLSTLRKETEKHGTVLIFDEVMCGFRVALNGAQAAYGIRPDLTCLGKIIGGGLPVAAYGGKREIMDCVSPKGPVYQAGTLSGNPIATTAGIETLKILKAHPEYYKQIDESAKKLADAYRKMAKEKNIPLHVNQIGSLLSAFQTGEVVDDYDSALTSDTNAYTEYFWKMLDNGIYVAPAQFEAMFVSVAHTKEDIERTCEVISL